MTTLTTTIEIQPLQLAELQNMSVVQLRAEMARSITMTAQAVARLASIWRELERRGEDLRDLKTGLAAFLPMVAAGKLHPELVVRYAGKTTLLKNLASIPTERQLALMHGERVRVVLAGGEETELPVEEIPSQRLSRVFVDGNVRPLAEQRLLEQAATAQKARRSRVGRKPKIVIDTVNNQFKLGKYQIPLSDVIAALREAGLTGQTGRGDKNA